MTKKIISLLVAVLMVAALVPMNAFALKASDGKLPNRDQVNHLKPGSAKPEMRDSVVYSADFETDPATDGWTFVDADGDGNNWEWSTSWMAYEGEGIILSKSYSGGVLTPDNWAWSPSFTVPATGYTYVDFYYAGQYPNYANEVFAVYAKVNGSDVKLTEDITATGGYVEEILDITAYAGQSIQIAIRHYNCTDMYQLNVDEFGVYNLDNEYDDGMTLVYTNSFETSDDLANVNGYDLDQDGDWFGWGSTANGFGVFDGDRALVCQTGTYNTTDQTFTAVLDADNLIVFNDAYTVPADGGAISFWASSADIDHAEAFYIWVATAEDWANVNTDGMYVVGDGDEGDEAFLATWLYQQYWLDVSYFAGQDICIGVESINEDDSNDHYFFQIDYLQYWDYDPEPVYYTVTFVDGLTNEVIDTQSVLEGGAATAPEAPAHEGYTFTGWDVDFSNVTSDLTVTAQYTINTYTVTFVDWDGSVIDTQTVAYGGAATAPADPTREGYTFTGWDVDFDNVTSDLTVTAQYEENAPAGLQGDVNCDGVVDSSDLTLAAAYAMNAGTVTAQGILNGDMNNDGVLNSADLSALYALIQG